MNIDSTDMYAALMHELKNNLGLLTMTLDAIPLRGDVEHDGRLDDARDGGVVRVGRQELRPRDVPGEPVLERLHGVSADLRGPHVHAAPRGLAKKAPKASSSIESMR